MLKFSEANAKIENLKKVHNLKKYLKDGKKVYSFDLLSGYSCPFANDCLAKVILIENKKKVKDGPNTEFRCFSASQEAVYPNVYNLRKNNFDTIRQYKTSEDMAQAIEAAMPPDLGICRIHVAGDFFNLEYLMAWVLVAKRNPYKLFYAYTKSIGYWVKVLGLIPDNLILTASFGGRQDNLIEKYNLRFAKVVYSEDAANGLPIDHDDSHAADPVEKNKSFALLIHGIQPKGTAAAIAVKELKGLGSYNRKK